MARGSKERSLKQILKRRKKQVDEAGSLADQKLERHFIRRLVRLGLVRRFIFGWLSLVSLLLVGLFVQIQALDSHYLKRGPIEGGVFIEGMIGSYKNINPLYASGTVDSSVSKLVFSGLLKYDRNNQLVGDLADSWRLDNSEKRYIVDLRKDVFWHDGTPFTARDVVFTFQDVVQDSEVQSPLEASWKGVKVSQKGDYRVIFTLPSVFGAFEHSLTTGVLPEHILRDVDPAQLRSSDFNNIEPIGTGPFKFDAIEVLGSNPTERSERVGLKSNDRYHLGAPKITSMIVRTFVDDESLINSFTLGETDAMTGLSIIPPELANEPNILEYSLPNTAGVYAFFNTSHDFLRDKNVRKALVLGASREKIIEEIGYPLLPLKGPLLSKQLGFSDKYEQKTSNKPAAEKLLNKAGWKLNSAGVREKRGVELKLRIHAQSTHEFTTITENLQKQWEDLGVKVSVVLQNDEDIKTTASLHSYEVLVSAISLGPDPDVFAFWHRTQSDVRAFSRLNFSEYESEVADTALEAGRSRTKPSVRAAKYETFQEQWREDAPALAFYQPRTLYIVRQPHHGFDVKSVVTAADRYTNIHEWQVREGRVPKLDQ